MKNDHVDECRWGDSEDGEGRHGHGGGQRQEIVDNSEATWRDSSKHDCVDDIWSF